MNCFNHPQEPAVAQCTDCGKGLCPECAAKYRPILCTSCYQKRKRSEQWRSILGLSLLVALFVIGYRLDFMVSDPKMGMQWMSGYILMAIWAGYLFVERFIPYKMVAGTNGQWLFYYAFKFILFVLVGVFTAPFTVLWALYRVIKAFRG